MQQRELRFRGWDTVVKEWCYGYEQLGGFNLLGEVVLMGELGRYPLEYLLNNIIFTQFTGLKDKSGKDIYEGDLIEVERREDKIIVECKFGTIERQMATGFLVDITGFYFQREDGTQTFPIKRNYAGRHDLEVFAIIGNIFQNPELMTTP